MTDFTTIILDLEKNHYVNNCFSDHKFKTGLEPDAASVCSCTCYGTSGSSGYAKQENPGLAIYWQAWRRLTRSVMDFCLTKTKDLFETKLKKCGHFRTISGHFFANYIIIFHKTEVQRVILKCLSNGSKS